MGEHRLGQRLDIVRHDVAAALDRGEGLARVVKMQGAAGARAERDLGVATGPPHQPSDVLAQLRLDEDFSHRFLGRPQLVRRNHRLELLHRLLDLVLVQQVRLFLFREIAKPDFHQETVELGFG